MNRIVLASASPRRKELMLQAGFSFEIQVSDKEEVYASTTPAEIVKELARLKAYDVADKNEQRNLTVIGADTVVSVDGEILGKPRSLEDASLMISKIAGREHEVYTGIAVLTYDDCGMECLTNEAVCTKVTVYPMTDDEIATYVRTQEVMDKAGAYALQGVFGAKFVEKIDGDYYNVVGLPISTIYHILHKNEKENDREEIS